MKKIFLALAVLGLFGAKDSLAQQWSFGTASTLAPPQSWDRKIFQVFKEINAGNHTFAVFGLTNPGGTGRSTEAIVVRDLSNPVQYELYKDLIAVYQDKRYIRKGQNNSRYAETVSWQGYTKFYNVYLNDYFWYWAE